MHEIPQLAIFAQMKTCLTGGGTKNPTKEKKHHGHGS